MDVTTEDKKYFETLLQKQTIEIDEKLKYQTVEIEKRLEKQTVELKKEFEHQTGALSEDFQAQVTAVAEQFLSLNEKVDEVKEILIANQEILLEHDQAIKELQRTQR